MEVVTRLTGLWMIVSLGLKMKREIYRRVMMEAGTNPKRTKKSTTVLIKMTKKKTTS